MLKAKTRHVQRRQTQAICEAFRQLDDRTLHDLGFDRSEILSLAKEHTGEAERTRVRALRVRESRGQCRYGARTQAVPARKHV